MANGQASIEWSMQGRGYEFCNCEFGCGCNFGGFPNSADGSCRALVGLYIKTGHIGDIQFNNFKCASLIDWPKAIHEGNGKCVCIVEPSTTEAQVEALAQVFTGKLGGMPWELLGPTFEVVGLQKANIRIEGEGTRSTFIAEGVAEGRGDTLKDPVNGEDHEVIIDLPKGFIWTRGECGAGSFNGSADGVSVGADNSNWIYYHFDWSNQAA